MQRLETDLLIIGSGAAGLIAAVTAQEKLGSIVLATKGRLFNSGSTFINYNKRWGITYATNDAERETLFQAIQTAGRGTNRESLSTILVEESHRAFERLREWGVRFQRNDKEEIKRIPPCFCNFPLAAIIESVDQFRSVMEKRLDRSRIAVLEEAPITELQFSEKGFSGAVAQTRDGQVQIRAAAAILATGGNAALANHTIVEPGLTGDGYALLTAAGIPLINMDYQQLVWEDVDLSGPRFPLHSFFDPGWRFVATDRSPIELPPPDALISQQRRTHVPIANLQPDRDFDQCLLKHINKPGQGEQPVMAFRQEETQPAHRILPHVQASNGGVLISENSGTPIPGLFAAGEVTTGMHGGDRVGGTMITATQVFGVRAARAALVYLGIK